MCRCLVKFVLFFVNLIFLIIGLLVIGGGVFVIYQLKSISDFTDQLPVEVPSDLIQELQADLNFVPYVIIGLGSIISIIAFFGCCGTITEVKCMLVTYASFLGLLAGAKIVIVILLFVKLAVLTESVENAINNMFLSDDPYQNATFHVLESQLQCCGTTGPESYVNDYNLTSPTCCNLNLNGTATLPIDNLPIDNLPIDNLPIDTVPNNQNRENLPIDLSDLPGNISIGDIDLGELGNLTACRREDAYQTGCTAMIRDAVHTIGRIFGIGLIIVIVFEVFALFFTIFLIKTMRPKLPKRYIEQPRYYY